MASGTVAVTVAVRVRPLNSRESKGGGQQGWAIDGSSLRATAAAAAPARGAAPPSEFTFDHLFDPRSTNADVYGRVARPIVRSVLEGINGTVFAYGQTSSGKTHTMMGSQQQPGVIPQAVKEVFNTVRKTVDREFTVRVSYLECVAAPPRPARD